METKSSVRWFHSDQVGAPQNNGDPGDIIAILDACLIDGYGTKSVDSIVVSDEVATVSISSGHDFEVYSVIRITGASPAELNDDWQVISAGASSLTFACPGIADQTATGTITALRATPGHWVKEFSDTNKAAYRSGHPDGPHYYLRLDDSVTASNGLVRASGFSAMQDADTGNGEFPLSPNLVNWARSDSSNPASAAPWTLIGDGAFFYLIMSPLSSYRELGIGYCFGKLCKSNPLDSGASIISGYSVSPVNSFTQTNLSRFNSSIQPGGWLASPFSGGDPVACGLAGSGVTASPSANFEYPLELNDGAVFSSPILVFNGIKIRGAMPGLLQGMGNVTDFLGSNNRQVIDVTAVSPAVLSVSCYTLNRSRAYFSFDILGPWR